MFLIHIQAKIGPTGNSFHRPRAEMVPMGNFSQKTHAQYTWYGMFLLQIQAETVPVVPRIFSVGCLPYPSRLKSCLRRAPPTNPCPVRSLQDVSLTHPDWNGAYRNSSHKPVPSMLHTGCFSYTSRLKWCLQDLHPQTSAQYAIYRMFLLHIQAQMVPMDNSHKPMPITISTGRFSYTSRLKLCIHWTTLANPCPVCSLRTCFSYTFMLNWCLQKLLPRTYTQYVL